MNIFKHDRKPRHIHDGTDPNDSWQPASTEADGAPILAEQPSHKPFLKIFSLIVGLAVIVFIVLSLGAYLYVKATPLSGESSGRINILVLGTDSTDSLSDTMILLSIDTASSPNKVAMISIPRDLYVHIPGFGHDRINSAYPEGGVALATATVKENLDIPIDYYMSVNFNGFKDMVDAVGGVNVNVAQTLSDPTYPNSDYSGFDPFYLAAGPQHLDGATALKYVRCRKGTCGSDFGRAARQQQLILAVKDKVVRPQTLLHPFELLHLWQAFQTNIKTDMSRNQLAKLALIIHSSGNNITKHVIDETNLLAPATINGMDVLVPKSGDFTDITTYINDVFTNPSNDVPTQQ